MPPPYTTQTTTADLLSDYAPVIKGKVILTTGVSPNSLGGFFVQSLAQAQPACLILAARNPEQLAQTAAALRASTSTSTSTSTSPSHPTTEIRTLQIDLCSLASVRAAAAEVNEWDDLPAIDVVVNNAGIMGVPDYRLSAEGFETHWPTNHLGPFLFTNLIMPKIVAAPNPRVVVVSSDGHRLNPVRFDDWNFDEGKSYDRWRAYGQSKTANMLFARSLAQKLGLKCDLQAFSLHPGVIFTNLDRDVDWSVGMKELQAVDRSLGNREGWKDEFDAENLERGAATHVYAAFDPSLKAVNGAYLVDCHVADPLVDTVKPWATSSFEAERLWRLSEKLVGQEFPY